MNDFIFVRKKKNYALAMSLIIAILLNCIVFTMSSSDRLLYTPHTVWYIQFDMWLYDEPIYVWFFFIQIELKTINSYIVHEYYMLAAGI